MPQGMGPAREARKDDRPALSEEGFAILRHAVNLARDEQIRKEEALRARLLRLYPRQEAAVKEAILYWAGYAKRSEALD